LPDYSWQWPELKESEKGPHFVRYTLCQV
jgi:hypothetical protein